MLPASAVVICAASAYIAAGLHIVPWASTTVFLLIFAAHAVVRGYLDRTLAEAW